MTIRKYENPTNLSPDQINEALEANDPNTLKRMIVGAAFYGTDSSRIEELCSILARHPDEEVRGNAILCLGHLARRFRSLSPKFRETIKMGLRDHSPYVRDHASAAKDDVNFFLKWKLRVPRSSPRAPED